MRRILSVFPVIVLCAASASTRAEAQRQPFAPSPALEAVIAEALAVRAGDPSGPGFQKAAADYRGVLQKLTQIARDRLPLDDQVDYDRLDAHVRTQLFEMETVRLHEVNVSSVFALGQTNAFIEVQRDSQTPSSPGREIIGELVIVQLRDEYKRRIGDHYSMKHFHDTLLTYGDLPFKQIRRLMFRD